jgi:hypothetical protein
MGMKIQRISAESRYADVAADGNPPPTYYPVGALRRGHRFPDFSPDIS